MVMGPARFHCATLLRCHWHDKYCSSCIQIHCSFLLGRIQTWLCLFSFIKNVNLFLNPNSRKPVCTVFKKWHLGRLVTVNGPNVKQFAQAVYCCNSSSNSRFLSQSSLTLRQMNYPQTIVKTAWLWGGCKKCLVVDLYVTPKMRLASLKRVTVKLASKSFRRNWTWLPNKVLRVGESNPGLPRTVGIDRRGYSPL